MIEEDNQDYDLLLGKFKNFFEQKCVFYNSQLEQQIVPKRMKTREMKTNLAVELKEVFRLLSDVSEGPLTWNKYIVRPCWRSSSLLSFRSSSQSSLSK
jgi:hypothetical protein